MGKTRLADYHYKHPNAPYRLEKLENKVHDYLYELGYPITEDMVEDIATLIYKREDIAFNKDDYKKL